MKEQGHKQRFEKSSYCTFSLKILELVSAKTKNLCKNYLLFKVLNRVSIKILRHTESYAFIKKISVYMKDHAT